MSPQIVTTANGIVFYNGSFLLINSLLIELRAVKTEKEIQIMRYANKVSRWVIFHTRVVASNLCVGTTVSAAHKELMRRVRPQQWEYQLEGLFLFKSEVCGLRKQAYEPICASGRNTAILHYVDNDKQLKTVDPKQVLPEDLVLVDAGAEFIGYSSDITRTYPSNGVFTSAQADLYQAVLNVQQGCIEALKPFIPWKNITSLSSRLLLEELLKVCLSTYL